MRKKGEHTLIIHGILSVHDKFDRLIHTLNEITENEVRQENRKIDWEETEVFDTSNQARHNSIHRKRRR